MVVYRRRKGKPLQLHKKRKKQGAKRPSGVAWEVVSFPGREKLRAKMGRGRPAKSGYREDFENAMSRRRYVKKAER